MAAINTCVRYQTRLCLFLDFLKFKAHIELTENSPDHVKLVHEALQSVAAFASSCHTVARNYEVDTPIPQFCQFSDSVVVSFAPTGTGEEFYRLGWAIILLQCQLLTRGFLVRGALTKGPLFHDGSIMFGPAIIVAVDLEKRARYPRIIVDGNLRDSMLDSIRSPEVKHAASLVVAEDRADKVCFFNYVDFSGLLTAFNHWPVKSPSGHLEGIRNLVEAEMRHPDAEVRAKYAWLAREYETSRLAWAQIIDSAQIPYTGSSPATFLGKDEINHLKMLPRLPDAWISATL